MEENNSILTETGVRHLSTAGKWAMFLGVMCFISAASMVLLGLLYVILGIAMPAGLESFGFDLEDSGFPVALFIVLGVFILVIGAFYIIPGVYLIRFNKASKAAILIKDPAQVEACITNVKSLFKFFGIYIICSIVASILMVLVVTAIAVAAVL